MLIAAARRYPRPVRRGWGALAAALVLTACGGDDGGDDGALRIATTVAPITSIVAAIAGDGAEVHGIVPEGTNSHTFEPKPSVAELLSTADVLFANGLHLETPTQALAEEAGGGDLRIVALGDEVLPDEDWIFDFAFPEEDGKPNPHLWTDPTYVIRYADVVRDALVELDPDGREGYEDRHAELVEQIDRLDGAMRTAFATIPAEDRKLVTYHDAYAYFAETYGFEIVGAIQVSDFEDPTPRELTRIIEQIEAEGIDAIFGSEVFPSPVLEQLERETGATYVDDLRDDDLPGSPGDAEHSLLGLLRFNYTTITEALGGNASALASLELVAMPDEAEYPQ